jgi:hypothetical protein
MLAETGPEIAATIATILVALVCVFTFGMHGVLKSIRDDYDRDSGRWN